MSVVQQPLLTQEVQHEGPEAALAALLHRHQQIALLHQASNQIFIQRLSEASIRNLNKTTPTSLRAKNTCVKSLRITLTDKSKAFCSMVRAAFTDSTNLVPSERIATFSGTFA